MLLHPVANRARTRSFWIIAGIAAGAVVSGLVTGAGAQPILSTTAGLILAVVTALIGYLAPARVSRLPYGLFNRVVSLFVARASRYVTWVAFTTVGRVLALSPEPRFEARADADTGWRPTGEMARKSQPGAWALVPMVALLRALGAGRDAGDLQDARVAAENYTLY